MALKAAILLLIACLIHEIFTQNADPDAPRQIQCYQCDSDFDPNCPADKPFDRNLNALVDCSSDEAHTPGTYCVKVEYRSPGWFGWHKTTRRCGSLSQLGSDNTCTPSMTDQGVYVRTCNCNTDGCNSASTLYSLNFLFLSLISLITYYL